MPLLPIKYINRRSTHTHAALRSGSNALCGSVQANGLTRIFLGRQSAVKGDTKKLRRKSGSWARRSVRSRPARDRRGAAVPLLVYCNVPIHQAVGTSAACGLPIAVAGAIGFVVAGWGEVGLPAGRSDYFYCPRPWWPGAPSAPLGARLAHTLPVATLRGGGRAHRPQGGGVAGSIQALGWGRAYRTRPQARKGRSAAITGLPG
jgi:hypothetical protein